MHFSSWLWEQEDASINLGRLVKLCWKDVNNGCANARFDAKQWVEHITNHHPESAQLLFPLLVEAYKEYKLFIKAN